MEGLLLALANIAFAWTVSAVPAWQARSKKIASRCLLGEASGAEALFELRVDGCRRQIDRCHQHEYVEEQVRRLVCGVIEIRASSRLDQLGSFFGVWLGGLSFDLSGSYDFIWTFAIAAGFVATLIHLPIPDKPLTRVAGNTV